MEIYETPLHDTGDNTTGSGTFFFYTTCRCCAKFHANSYVVIVVEVN